MGHNKNAELPLLRQQRGSFSSGDIFLGDKGFCSYYNVWQFKARGVNSVITLARRTPVSSASAVAVLGPDDLLIKWPKPVWNKNLSYSKEEWQALPEHLDLRQIKVTINAPGMRSTSYYLITTLLDASRYSAAELADLYRQRWAVELFFRDIKTTLGMDVLRCRTPDLMKKEVLVYFIAYNAVRRLIVDAANAVKCAPQSISFKACIQAVRQWESQLHRCAAVRLTPGATLWTRDRRLLAACTKFGLAENGAH